MKSTALIPPAILCMAVASLFVSCRKEPPIDGGGNRPGAISNKPPFAVAGSDVTIMLPADNIQLDGSASNDPDGKITRFVWRQVSGAPVAIADSLLAKTTARGVIPGVYQFELTVTDNGGLSSRDTLAANILPPGQFKSPYYAENLSWIFPWYAALEIENIFSHVPPGSPLKVFIQRGTNPTWIAVPPLSTDSNNNNTYEYFIEARFDGGSMYTYGSLFIFYYGTNTGDTPNVKIEF